MRLSRLTGVLAGFLIALLASGSLRLAHLAIAHTTDLSASTDTCAGCPQNPSPLHRDSPGTPAHPSPSDCTTCGLLAVLLPDGLPVANAPFFPASPGVVVVSGLDRRPSNDRIGLALARGPPALTHHS